MAFNPAEELENEKAHALIKEILSMDGEFIVSRHAKERMKERGYTLHDVEYILLHGTITGKQFVNSAGNWRYIITGPDLDGTDGSAVTTIIHRNAIVLVTVLS